MIFDFILEGISNLLKLYGRSMLEFDRCYAIVLREEGGFVNDPEDTGGPTNYGVTQKRYDEFREKALMPRRSVREIGIEERKVIYLSYWRDAHCNEMMWPMNLVQYAFAVNAGPGAAIRILQRALDVVVDGYYGPKTRNAVILANQSMFTRTLECYAMLLEQVFFYDSLDETDARKTRFLTKLWLKRLKHIYQAINKAERANAL